MSLTLKLVRRNVFGCKNFKLQMLIQKLKLFLNNYDKKKCNDINVL